MRKLKKVLAIVLTLSLVLSMSNVAAFAGAAETDNSQQIVQQGGTVYYDKNGEAVTDVSELDKDGAVVSLSKTIAPTTTENYFDITLNVQTLLDQETIISSPDAAVVLTIDMSGTMYNNKMDGERYVNVAKAKAIEFVEDYADSVYYGEIKSKGKRNLAVIAYDTDATVKLDWIDVATDEGLEQAKTAINNIKVAANGDTSSPQVCTNFDGGLMLTRNLLAQSSIDKAHTWAIVMSDGAPTVTSNESASTTEIESTFWTGQGYQKAKAGGGWTHPKEVENNLTYLQQINQKANVCMIGVGGLMNITLFHDAVYGTGNGTRTADVKNKPDAFNNVDALAGYNSNQIMAMTTGDWMKLLADYVNGTYASASNTEQLEAAFSAIMKQIQPKEDDFTFESKGWVVTDIMGDYIEYVALIDGSEEQVQVDADGTITWNLEENDTKTYEMTYRVRLMNEADGFVALERDAEGNAIAGEYVANEAAYFNLEVAEDDVLITQKDVAFPVPSVGGYLADFSFNKVDDIGQPLAGAEFALTHTDACGVEIAVETAVSDEQGIVSFRDIPSGHSYTLTEVSAPDGYVQAEGSAVVTVAYDVLTLGEGLVVDGLVENDELTSVSGVKHWNDEDDQDGKRPGSIFVQLYAGEDAVEGKIVEVSAKQKWTYSFDGLYKYDADGNEIVYSVREINVPDGYEVSYEKTDEGYDVINSYTPETIDISGVKQWNDEDDQDGMRPDAIVINLYADNALISTAIATAEGGWTYSFEDLDKYRDHGTEIVYVVVEEPVAGYTSEVIPTDAGFDIVNTHDVEKTDVTVTKVWQDNDDELEVRPVSVTAVLYANGVETGLSAELNEENGWYAEFNDLDVYADGEVIVYDIVEIQVPGYTSEVEAEGYDFTITNTIRPLPEDENIIEEKDDPKKELPEDEYIIEDDEIPETGDQNPIAGLMVMMFAAFVGLIMMKTRKEN